MVVGRAGTQLQIIHPWQGWIRLSNSGNSDATLGTDKGVSAQIEVDRVPEEKKEKQIFLRHDTDKNRAIRQGMNEFFVLH